MYGCIGVRGAGYPLRLYWARPGGPGVPAGAGTPSLSPPNPHPKQVGQVYLLVRTPLALALTLTLTLSRWARCTWWLGHP